MADQLKIEVGLEALKGITGKLQNIYSSLDTIQMAIDNITSETEPIWEGKARNQYAENSTEMRKKLVTLTEQVQERKISLESAISVYEKTEKSNVAAVEDLSADYIF